MRSKRRVFVSPVIVATLAASAAFADSNPSSMRQPQEQQQQVEERGIARPVQTAPKIVFVSKSTAKELDQWGYESDTATLTFKNVGNTAAKGDGYKYTLTIKPPANGICWNSTGHREWVGGSPNSIRQTKFEPGPEGFPDADAGATFEMHFKYVEVRDPKKDTNIKSCNYDMTIDNDGKQTKSSISFAVPG